MSDNNTKITKKSFKEDPYSSFTVGSLFILAILFLFFFFGWSYIYNTEYGVEIGINGWNYICLGFSHAFKSTNTGLFGNVDSFYYYVKGLVVAETIITFIAFWLVVALSVIAGFNVRKANRKLVLIAGIASVVLAIVFLGCFVVALSMTPKMVSGYCGGNKKCSVHSLALLSFFVALGNAIVNFALLHKMNEDTEESK